MIRRSVSNNVVALRGAVGDAVSTVVGPPLWREARFGMELASLLRDRTFRDVRPARDPQAVLLVPGFLTGDRHLRLMHDWLRRAGHETAEAGIRLNVDCSASAVERLEERLERFSKGTGKRSVVIGQSRGGLFARVLAARRPDLVESLVTLGSPHVGPMRVHPFVLAQGAGLATLGSLGLPGIARHSCRNGHCCADFWDDLRAPLPGDVTFYSLYSKSDGIVHWRACLDPDAHCIEIASSHCGMAVNRETYGALSRVLEGRRRTRVRPSTHAQAA